MDIILSSVNCFSKLIKPKEGLWELPIYTRLVTNKGNNLELRLESEWGGKSNLAELNP